MMDQMGSLKQILYGHANGDRVELHNVKEVAQFIYQQGLHGDVLITDAEDTPFIATFGIFIDKISDMDYRRELLKELVPLQMGEQAPDEEDAMAMAGM